jgi:hypothetical protein
MGIECIDMPGVPGRRNADPPLVYLNHFKVIYGGKFYDPSFGLPVVANQGVGEMPPLMGYLKVALLTLAGFKKTSHSSTNSSEFYTLRTDAKK